MNSVTYGNCLSKFSTCLNKLSPFENPLAAIHSFLTDIVAPPGSRLDIYGVPVYSRDYCARFLAFFLSALTIVRLPCLSQTKPNVKGIGPRVTRLFLREHLSSKGASGEGLSERNEATAVIHQQYQRAPADFYL